MSAVISCRSQAEIDDDNVVWTHSECVEALALWCCGAPLYVGARRRQLVALRDKCEKVIMGELAHDAAFRYNPAWLYQQVLSCR